MTPVEQQTSEQQTWQATDGYLSDDALIERLLGHIERGTTDLVADVWREPVANYQSAERFAAEVELVRRSPTPFCPSAFIDEPGSFVARTAAGIPLVAVRDRERRVHVFKNSCRHRGTQLVEGTGCAQSLTCPFHGWTYALDGRLRRIPDDFGFPDVDPAQHGLVEVPSHECSGLVIVEQAAPDVGASIAGRHVPTILGERPYRSLGVSQTVVDANWKILVEGFLEGYHLKATHRDTFFPGLRELSRNGSIGVSTGEENRCRRGVREVPRRQCFQAWFATYSPSESEMSEMSLCRYAATISTTREWSSRWGNPETVIVPIHPVRSRKIGKEPPWYA